MTGNLKIEMWAIDRVLPYADNARLHSHGQVTAIATSIREFGFVNPVLVDADGVLVAGHGRVLGARAIGMETIPVIKLGHLTAKQTMALRIADNALPMQATWNQRLLTAEIGKLRLQKYDIRKLGFTDAQLRGYGVNGIARAGANGDAEAKPKKGAVKKGELWLLGRHKLFCGDATDPKVWETLFGAERASVVHTDPPYGVSYKADGFQVIEGDHKRRDALYQMLVRSMRNLAEMIREDAAVYIWHASLTRKDFEQAMTAAGLIEHQYLMWVKPNVAFGPADYQWQHEPCFYASKGATPKFYGGQAESTVWRVSTVTGRDTAATIGNGVLLLDGQGGEFFIQARAPKGKKVREIRVTEGKVYLAGDQAETTVWEVARDSGYIHPTQKPVELARRAIENSSQAGEIVADAFAGSGSTLIACEMTGRRFFGTEIDPQYVQAIIDRWQEFTGKEAVLAGTDQSGRPSSAVRGRASAAQRRTGTTPSPRALGRVPSTMGMSDAAVLAAKPSRAHRHGKPRKA
jgi:DNA modification methylase